MEDIGASWPQLHSKQVFVRVVTTMHSRHPGSGQHGPGHDLMPNPGLPGRVCLHRSMPLPMSHVSTARDSMGHPETLPIGLILTADREQNCTWRAEARGALMGESLH